MKLKNLTPFPFGTKVTSRRPPRPEMTLVLRATYLLAPGKPLTLPEGPTLVAQGPMTRRHLPRRRRRARRRVPLPRRLRRLEAARRGDAPRHLPHPRRQAPRPSARSASRSARWSKILRVVGRRFWSDDMARRRHVRDRALHHDAARLRPRLRRARLRARTPSGKGFASRELPNVEHAGARHPRPPRRPRPGRLRPDQPGVAAARRQGRQGVRPALEEGALPLLRRGLRLDLLQRGAARPAARRATCAATRSSSSRTCTRPRRSSRRACRASASAPS